MQTQWYEHQVYLTKLDGDPDCAMSHEEDRLGAFPAYGSKIVQKLHQHSLAALFDIICLPGLPVLNCSALLLLSLHFN